MYRPAELFIALRHLRSKSRSRFVSFIALSSLVGIAIAVAVLIVVLSVMNGFEYEVKNRILAVVSHASITGLEGKIENWQVLSDIAAGADGVTAVAPFTRGEGMLVSETGTAGIELRGVLPQQEATVSGAASLVSEGNLNVLESRAYRIVLGKVLAERLGVSVGDNVILMTMEGSVTPVGLIPRMRRFQVAGIFYAGMYEFDRGLAYVHLDDAGRMLRMGGTVTGISMAVAEPLAAPDIVRSVARAFGGEVYVSDWTRQHANFFRSIELTKAIIFIILLMVVAVAAFNIVSTLVMVVREKAAEIAILRSMGASAATILWIFVLQGTLIGLVGTVAGLAFGMLVALNLAPIVGALEALLQVQFVAPDVYFISELPSRPEFDDIWRICAVAFVLSVLATVYPALRAAWTNPATALRHE
jgi:lipoprotein-releasing system permease protein